MLLIPAFKPKLSILPLETTMHKLQINTILHTIQYNIQQIVLYLDFIDIRVASSTLVLDHFLLIMIQRELTLCKFLRNSSSKVVVLLLFAFVSSRTSESFFVGTLCYALLRTSKWKCIFSFLVVPFFSDI